MEDKKLIQIVEDEAITAILYSKILARAGFRVCKPVATGQEAIDIAESDNPDIILMDINLIGEMDGIEAAERILENRPIPIIFITGYSNEDTHQRAMKLNPVAFLTKPLTLDRLSSTIRSALT